MISMEFLSELGRAAPRSWGRATQFRRAFEIGLSGLPKYRRGRVAQARGGARLGRVRRALACGARRSSRRARERFLRLCIEPLEDRSLLATFVVTTELDLVNAGDGVTSLREAVIQANSQAGLDTITFASALANKPLLLLSGTA